MLDEREPQPAEPRGAGGGRGWMWRAGLIAAAFAAPLFLNDLWLYLLVIVNIWALLAVTWGFKIAVVGLIDLGHAVFFGAGAYATAFLTTRFGVDPWLALAGSGFVAVLVGLVVALPALRLIGGYLAILTLAYSEAMRIFATTARDYTGAEEGIRDIPPLLSSMGGNYLLTLGILVLSAALLFLVRRSSWGILLRSIKNDEEAAGVCGVNTSRYKIFALSLTAYLAGVGGSLYAAFFSITTPDVLAIALTGEALIIAHLGGEASIVGPPLGAALFILLTNQLGFLEDYRLLVFSSVVLVLIYVMPQGIVPELRNRLRRPWFPLPWRREKSSTHLR
ncbi:MAG: branched-chain amino acid ABC transporter permease [Candidatus Tectomicrobia bacterium]|nr:branched-chain amino acid ABC transporter permease [Candidatus Tectomicrobia bacterium]